MLKFLDGYKTYILGAVTILIGVLELIGIDVVAAVDQTNAFNYILGGFAMITAKSALVKTEPSV